MQDEQAACVVSSSFTAIGPFASVRCGAAICPKLGVNRKCRKHVRMTQMTPKRSSLWRQFALQQAQGIAYSITPSVRFAVMNEL